MVMYNVTIFKLIYLALKLKYRKKTNVLNFKFDNRSIHSINYNTIANNTKLFLLVANFLFSIIYIYIYVSSSN